MPDGKMLKFVASRVADSGKSEQVGKVVAADKSIIIACGSDGSERIEITRVLPEGKGRMDTADYLRGRKLVCGDVLN
jgi:methionyl-tRNA formyltransferase